MHIKVEEFADLCEQYPELKAIDAITAKHGEQSDISDLCEVIAHLYQRFDTLQSKPITNVKSVNKEK